MKFILSLAFVSVLVTVQSNARDSQCEEKQRSLAALDIVVDSLCKAKDLYPNCEDADDISISSECGNKGKSLGYIDVALNLVSDAKTNFPDCPPPPKQQWPMDCRDLLENGHTESGVYQVYPRSRIVAEGTPVDVRCDMDTDGGGWTVIQRRGNFTEQENFNRDWADYKNGFGNLSQDFWIGNDNIFALSNQGAYALRLDMTNIDGNSAYEIFEEFWIGDENSNYILHVGKPNGTAGGSMAFHNGKMFSTKDRHNDVDNTESCAVSRQSGFWFGLPTNGCVRCNPNGLYRPGEEKNVKMYCSLKSTVGLVSIEMKLKRL